MIETVQNAGGISIAPLNHVQISTNGIALHAVQAGRPEQPLVILLHGFPEFWYSWRHQIPVFSEAGFFVIAPDMRGYNLSDKPKGLRSYTFNTLAADVIGLIDALDHKRAFLAGHDWGALVAWWVAQNYPERVERLAVLNVPHPEAFRTYVFKHPKQLLKSWYVAFFQLPFLPEATLRLLGWRVRPPVHKQADESDPFTEEDRKRYRAAILQPGAAQATINYYRANPRFPLRPRIASPRIHVPTLILWGNHEPFLDRELAHHSADLCDDARLVMLEASHWIQNEQPERVSEELVTFFSEPRLVG